MLSAFCTTSGSDAPHPLKKSASGRCCSWDRGARLRWFLFARFDQPARGQRRVVGQHRAPRIACQVFRTGLFPLSTILVSPFGGQPAMSTPPTAQETWRRPFPVAACLYARGFPAVPAEEIKTVASEEVGPLPGPVPSPCSYLTCHFSFCFFAAAIKKRKHFDPDPAIFRAWP